MRRVATVIAAGLTAAMWLTSVHADATVMAVRLGAKDAGTLAKFYEVVKFFTWSSYVVEPRPVIMSKSFFDGLPADFQKVLSETALESAVFERKVFEERSAGALEEAKKNGMTFVELTDRDKWVDLMRPVWEEFGKATPGAAELIKIIQTA